MDAVATEAEQLELLERPADDGIKSLQLITGAKQPPQVDHASLGLLRQHLTDKARDPIPREVKRSATC